MVKHNIVQGYYDQNVLKLALEHDLILLDLDDVVLTPNQFVCSTQWYYKYYLENKDLFIADELVYDIHDCRKNTKYKHVSLQLIQDFSELAKSKIVVGFTARERSFAEETESHLKEVGMSFSYHYVQNNYISNAVVYVGLAPDKKRENDKGLVLKELLDSNVFGNVKSVLLIYDSSKNIDNVNKALSDDIKFTSIHYTEVNDRLLKDYTEEQLMFIGDRQFRYFSQTGMFLSNNEALEE